MLVSLRLDMNEPLRSTSILGRRRFGELVEDVEVALVDNLTYDSRLLQQVVVDVCANGFSL